ncbi:MAG: hypothetical protein M0R66_02135 [Candidatus Omnitrophica bacterium]|nr:hypothetical protein [Candidatus Omnitrophota bacterium]
MAWIIVNGEVTNTFHEGKGAKVKETFTKRDGTEGTSFYSVWFEAPHGLSIGDKGKFSGPGSVSAEEYEGTWYGRLSINNARFEPGGDAKPF